MYSIYPSSLIALISEEQPGPPFNQSYTHNLLFKKMKLILIIIIIIICFDSHDITTSGLVSFSFIVLVVLRNDDSKKVKNKWSSVFRLSRYPECFLDRFYDYLLICLVTCKRIIREKKLSALSPSHQL